MASPSGSINAVPKPFHGVWEGESKIVVGIDVGTTQSGVAFAFLQRGRCLIVKLYLRFTQTTARLDAEQTIHRVTRWPGQEAQNLQSKVPTLVWYDHDKKAL